MYFRIVIRIYYNVLLTIVIFFLKRCTWWHFFFIISCPYIYYVHLLYLFFKSSLVQMERLEKEILFFHEAENPYWSQKSVKGYAEKCTEKRRILHSRRVRRMWPLRQPTLIYVPIACWSNAERMYLFHVTDRSEMADCLICLLIRNKG